jgi:tRNA U34 5-methylaminomethyl-2-thiouridine-forming methyltransferase MnmC
MPGRIILTQDGSHTIEAGGGLTYHSTFGAIRESQHIFIEAGLRSRPPGPLRIFEMGFGTGLNALLSLMEDRPIEYETVELEPLPVEQVKELNYCLRLGRPDLAETFAALHEAPWGHPRNAPVHAQERSPAIEVKPGFLLKKYRSDIRGYQLACPADLVYYDAFDPVAQPDLWTAEVFENLRRQMAPAATLVTYCCKGAVRRALQAVGFSVEKLPGPPGKREMLRAYANV